MIVAMVPFSFNSDFIDERWVFVLEERDKQSNALKVVDFSKTKFVSGFHEEDKEYAPGAGEVKLARLRETGRILYGATVFEGLWQNYLEKKKTSVLEILFREQNITFMTFFGDIFLDPVSQKRCVLALCRYDRNGGEWRKDIYWLDFTWSNKHLTIASNSA